MRSRARRFAVLFIALALFGAVPALAALLWGGRRGDHGPWLEAEARMRAALVDLVAERWLGEVQARAGDLNPLLEQLPEAPFGRAAEGTIVLYLQRKLDREMTEYTVLSPDGKVVLSTGRARGAPMPEIAQAARRPAAALVRAGGETQLVVAAPLTRRGRFVGLVVGRPSAAGLALPLGASALVEVNLVDGNGVQLTGRFAGPELARLGSESAAGLSQLSGRAAAVAPLQSMRAVVVAVAVTPETGRWRWPVAGSVVVLLLAALVAWALAKTAPPR